MATVTVNHTPCGGPVDASALVDGPTYDNDPHIVTGLEHVQNVDTTNADNITGGSQTGTGAMVRAGGATLTGTTTLADVVAQTLNTNSVNPLSGTFGVDKTVNGITVQVDQMDVGTNTVRGFNFYHNFGSSSVKGARIGAQFTLNEATPSSAANASRSYTALMALASSDLGDGGTGISPAGSYWAMNPYVQLKAGATFVNEASGIELNTDLQTGSSVLYKYGVKVVQMATDAASGSVNDAAFSASNNVGAVGWDTVFQVGDGVFASPLKTTGTILKVKGTPTIGYGIDLSGASITNFAFRSTGFTVNGFGSPAVGASGLNASVTINNIGTSGRIWQVFSSDNSSATLGTGNLAFYDATGTRVVAAMTANGGVNIGGVADPGLANLNVVGKIGVSATTVTADSLLTVNANTGASVAPTANTNLHVVGADGVNNIIAWDSYGGGVTLQGRQASGTQASKTAVGNGSGLLQLSGQGWDTTAYGTGAQIVLRATETYSASAHGGEIAFRTIPNTTIVAADGLVVRNSGGVTIGTTTDPGIGAILANTSIKSQGATAGIGYATGAGGAVTQLTSRTTGVTLNTSCGAITLFAAAPAVGTWVSFTVTSSAVVATDVPHVAFKSGTNTYIGHVSAVAAGSFQVSFTSIVGTASDSAVINFALLKATAS